MPLTVDVFCWKSLQLSGNREPLLRIARNSTAEYTCINALTYAEHHILSLAVRFPPLTGMVLWGQV